MTDMTAVFVFQAQVYPVDSYSIEPIQKDIFEATLTLLGPQSDRLADGYPQHAVIAGQSRIVHMCEPIIDAVNTEVDPPHTTTEIGLRYRQPASGRSVHSKFTVH